MNKELFGTKCVCLARVSTSAQDYQAQINALHKKADEFGLTIVKDIATKESGFKSYDKKEGFSELVKFMKDNDCRIVLCTELSRLSRKKFLLEQIKQWFIDNKIQLWVDDITFQLFNDKCEVDMTTDIVFSVFAAMAESEMKDKKKRMKRGIVELNKAGYSLTGKVTFGYTRKKSTEKIKGKFRSVMDVNEKEAEQIRTVYNWYLNGIDGVITKCSISQIHQECIARGFGKYLQSRSNVKKCLKNGLYTGHVITSHRRKNPEYWIFEDKKAPKYIETGSEMTITPIISQEVFDAVQAKMKGVNTRLVSTTPNTYADKSHKHNTLLAKMIYCPACGKFYLGDYRTRGGRDSYNYRCQNHKRHGASIISMKLLDYSVWAFCQDNFEKYLEYIQKFPGKIKSQEIKERIANIRLKRDEYEKELENLGTRFLLVKSLAASKAATDKFKQESNRIQKEIAACDAMLRREEKSLAESMKADVLSQDKNKTLSFIRSNKNEMKKFIAYVIRAVIPIFHNLDYIVVQVILHDNKMVYCTVDPEDNAPVLINNTYLVIHKRDNHRPKFLYISGHCKFDIDTKTFILPNFDKATLDEAMEDNDEVYFKKVKYTPLSIYGEDKPKDIGSVTETVVLTANKSETKPKSEVV